MLKRIFTALSLVFVFGMLAGCQGGTTTVETKVAGGAPATKRFKVGVSIPAADHGWTAGVGYWAKEAAKLHPDIDWIIEDAKEENEQISDLENLQNQGVDALVILCTRSAPITPIAKKLKQAGILIINVDRGFTEPIADVFIEGDNSAFGRKSAEYIVVKMGADPKKLKGARGNLVILRGINSTVDDDRYNAAMKVFQQNPGIKIVATERGEWNREIADKTMQNILIANPKIDVIWAQDDDMALGAENALKAAGRDKQVWMLGGAGMKDIVKRVMDGDSLYPADITYPPSMIAVGMQTAAGILRAGRKDALEYMPKHMMLDVQMIFPDNAKEFYFPDSVF